MKEKKKVGNRWSGPVRALMRLDVASYLNLMGLMDKNFLGKNPCYIGTGANSLVFEELLASGRLGPKFSIVESVEKDNQTYKEALEILPRGVTLRKIDLEDETGPDRPWDFVWWDGMGKIHRKSLNLLQQCTESVCAAGGGLVGITYQANRENSCRGVQDPVEAKLVKRFTNDNKKNDNLRKNLIAGAVKKTTRKRGMICDPVITIKYRELPGHHQAAKGQVTQPHSTPMIVQFFAVAKTKTGVKPILIDMGQDTRLIGSRASAEWKAKKRRRKGSKYIQLELL